MTDRSPNEILSFIEETMKSTRRSIVERGFSFVSWGLTVPLGTFATYLLLHFRLYLAIPAFWLLLFAVNMVVNSRYYRGREIRRSRTILDRIYQGTWLFSSGVMVAAITGTFLSGASFGVMFGVMALILGIAYFITSIIAELRIIRICSFGWIAGALLLFSWRFIAPDLYTPALFCVLTVLFELIPGYILWRTSGTTKAKDDEHGKV